MTNFLKNVLAAIIVAAQFGTQKLGVGMGSLMELGACTFIITYQGYQFSLHIYRLIWSLVDDWITGSVTDIW